MDGFLFFVIYFLYNLTDQGSQVIFHISIQSFLQFSCWGDPAPCQAPEFLLRRHWQLSVHLNHDKYLRSELQLSALTDSKQISRSPKLQILPCYKESIIRFIQNLQSSGGLFLFISLHKNTVRLICPTSNTPSQLMKLRKSNHPHFSTIITVAFGTFTPTSTTVVDTSTWFLLANCSAVPFFSLGFIFPWSIPMVMSDGKISLSRAV